MYRNDLFVKFNSKQAADLFTEFYGKDTASARNRLKTLVSDIFENDNTVGGLRVFSAPGRTELAGNHTDHNNGRVLAASINLDSVAVVQARCDNVVFYRSTGFPDVTVKLTDENGEFDLQPKPEEKGKTESLIRGIAAEFHKRGHKICGFSANADSKVLPGSGLSSSAALEVLVGRIFDSLCGEGNKTSANFSPLEIAQIGHIAENAYFGKPCGLMDQIACATGGAVAVDFADTVNPRIKKINFDFSAAGFVLCVVNTGGSHADLTADYAAIPSEMKAVAAYLGKTVLAETEKDEVVKNSAKIKKALGERAFQRAIHFFEENERVNAMIDVLSSGKDNFYQYLDLAAESGESSRILLQNIYPSIGVSKKDTPSSALGSALDMTKEFFRKEGLRGACRVHGGGFAGTIQVYIPQDSINAYRSCMEAVFGEGSVTPLKIRKQGAVELAF